MTGPTRCGSDAVLFPDFFGKRGVAVMTVRELFDFITDPSITSSNMEAYLDKVSRTQQNFTSDTPTARDLISVCDWSSRPW